MPSWICCNLEGNGRDSSNESVEMDVYESAIQEIGGDVSYNGEAYSVLFTSSYQINSYHIMLFPNYLWKFLSLSVKLTLCLCKLMQVFIVHH